MREFISVVFGFPTFIYSLLLAVVLVYWVAAIIGLVDFGESSIDLDIAEHADVSVDDLGTIAGFVVAFGLSGVPFSIVVTLLVVIGWTLSTLAGIWVLAWVPTLPLQIIAGLVVLAACFALSIVIAARIVRPLRGAFVTDYARQNSDLIGQTCIITTGSVDEKQGYAQVAQRGAGILIQVWSPSPNPLRRGSSALIVEYDPAARRYLVQSMEASP
ncbi:MAG: ubiquinone biosynthesis protein [Comamonadaceae bacterium]|nr:MAG: ubiquinone biosynthesis protein [Comamonadaceae bacterium]